MDCSYRRFGSDGELNLDPAPRMARTSLRSSRRRKRRDSTSLYHADPIKAGSDLILRRPPHALGKARSRDGIGRSPSRSDARTSTAARRFPEPGGWSARALQLRGPAAAAQCRAEAARSRHRGPCTRAGNEEPRPASRDCGESPLTSSPARIPPERLLKHPPYAAALALQRHRRRSSATLAREPRPGLHTWPPGGSGRGQRLIARPQCGLARLEQSGTRTDRFAPPRSGPGGRPERRRTPPAWFTDGRRSRTPSDDEHWRTVARTARRTG